MVLDSCLSEAHKLFPDHVNIDVIFGRPHQTVSNWMTELKQVHVWHILASLTDISNKTLALLHLVSCKLYTVTRLH